MATTERTAAPATWKERLEAVLDEIRASGAESLPDEAIWREIDETIEDLRREWRIRSSKALVERIRTSVPPDVTEEEIDRITDEVIAEVRSERHARGL
jgi:hypothetical protein